jgi:PKD repeat protein
MNPTFRYPLFEENQVLSYQHLNRLAEFLDGQDRTTRRSLLGAGVVFGLELSEGLRLTGGAALTSDGYLCHLDEVVTFTAARTYADPSNYQPFLPRGAQIDLWELVAAADAIASDTPLSGGFLNNKAALLFLETTVADLDTCIDNHCLNQGKEHRLVWRVLLGAHADLEAMRKAAIAARVPYPAWDLPEVRFERLLLRTPDVATHEALARRGVAFLGPASQRLRQAIRIALRLYAPLLEVTPAAADQAIKGLETDFDAWIKGRPTENFAGWQYGLDHLRHLHLAWAEFLEAAFAFRAEPARLFEDFPRHVLLGAIPAPGAPPPGLLRHLFVPSPALTLGGLDRELCRQRFQRLLAMASRFAVPERGDVRITPGANIPEPLDCQALPFYYRPPEAVLAVWNETASVRGRFRRLPSYHREVLDSAPEVQDPLRFRIREPGFYRIEGHQGLQRRAVEKILEALRRQYNLPFSVVTVAFGPADDGTASCLCDLDQIKALYLVTAAELRCHLARLLEFLGRRAKPAVAVKKIIDRLGADKFQIDIRTLDVVGAKLAASVFAPGAGTAAAAVPGGAASEEFTTTRPTTDAIRAGDVRQVKLGKLEMIYPIVPVDIYVILSPEVLVTRLSQELIGRLMEADQRLTAEIEVFDAVAFERAIAAVRDKAVDLKDAITRLLAAGTEALRNFRRDDLEALQQEIILFLANCVPTRLQQVVAQFANRLARLKATSTLATFFARHPGIEHLGGVPRGGTFILVVGRLAPAELPSPSRIEARSERAVIDRRDTISRKSTSVFIEGLLGGSTIKEDERADLLEAYESLPQDQPALAVDLVKVFENLRDFFTFDVEGSDEETVLADFCLPYVCCSECTCTTTVVIPPPVATSPNIGLPRDAFCVTDETFYRFKLAPPDGRVSGPGVEVVDEHPGFRPAKVPDEVAATGRATFTYTTDGGTASVTATLVASPEVKVSVRAVEQPSRSGTMVLFANETEGDAEFEWDFGDGSNRSNERAPRHLYREPGPRSFTVKVTATRGPCTATATLPVEIPAREEPISIEVGTEFCANDPTAHPVAVTPPDGRLEGRGVTAVAGGFNFTPASAGTTGPVELIYTVSGRSARITIQLVAPPRVAFEHSVPEPTGGGFLVRFTNRTDADAVSSWSFGDGTGSSERDPEHLYQRSGTFTIELKARRGPCVVVVTSSISIRGERPPIEDFDPNRFRVLRNDPLFERVVGTENTVLHRSARTVNTTVAEAAVNLDARRALETPEGEGNLAEAADSAFRQVSKKLIETPGDLGTEGIDFLWKYQETTIVTFLTAMTARSKDIAADGPSAKAFGSLTDQVKRLRDQAETRRLKFSAEIDKLLTALEADTAKPNLQTTAKALRTA